MQEAKAIEASMLRVKRLIWQLTSLPLLTNAGRVDETIKLILIWKFLAAL